MAEADDRPGAVAARAAHPKIAAGRGFLTARDKSVAAVARRYGPTFTLDLPIFGGPSWSATRP